MDAAAIVEDFRVQCVAPLAAGACPVMAADAAGLTRIVPPAGSGKGVMAWRTPGGGALVIDAYATNACRVILPIRTQQGGALSTLTNAPAGVRISVESIDKADVLVAEAEG
jgi:hypothetical protein